MLSWCNDTFWEQFLNFSIYDQWVTGVECFPPNAQVLCGPWRKLNILTLNTIKNFWVRSYCCPYVKKIGQLTTLEALHLLVKYCFILGTNNVRLFTSKSSSVSAKIIVASSPGPGVGKKVFGVALSSTDGLWLKKAWFPDQIFGSFAKGVPSFVCGDSQLLCCLPC